MSERGIKVDGRDSKMHEMMDFDGGVDAEMDEEIKHEEAGGNAVMSSHQQGNPVSSSTGKESSEESPRKHRNSSERRRRHHHHHHSNNSSSNSSHHKRLRSGGHSGEDSEALEDSGRTRRRSDSTGDDHSSSRTSHRRNNERRSSRSQRSHHPDAGHDDLRQDELDAPSRSKKMDREKTEAEDGEILEDGELDDDDANDNSMPQEESRLSLDTSHEDTEESPSKSHSKGPKAVKEDVKSQKRDKRKQEHRDKRKKEDDKKKRKKYVDVDKMSDEEAGQAPAWGSGYQGARPKGSPHRGRSRSPSYGKSSKGSRGKGFHSPPGLYDSPSYSEGSEDDQYPQSFGMLSGGYVDASVAADEKEGIFKRGMTFKKKKRMDRNPGIGGKRRSQDMGKGEGPPKKKALADIAMSDRPKCKFYRDGKCAKGSGCPFNHDVEQPQKMEVCKYHLTVKGCHKERCLYMHDFPCKYYHTGAQCFSGDRCKFSHDPLSYETRRALEMRVAPEDIIDMDDPDYDQDYDYLHRNYESRPRPSLLGSPPRRHDVKKIPSLFDIEVHPPAHSPNAKPSPSSVRPTGFYNEAGSSPPSSGSSSGNSQVPAVSSSSNSGNSNNTNNNNINSSNNNTMGNTGGSAGPNNQGPMRPGLNNAMSGPGLLQTPNMPPVAGGGPLGPMMGGPMGANRPALIANQPMRPNMPFLNNANNNNAPANLPPVLNMLGAIIREAAMQNVSQVSAPNMNNVGGMNMGPNNMNNVTPSSMSNAIQNSINTMGANAMQAMTNNMNSMVQANMNAMGQNNMNNMGQNNMNNMSQNNMNNMSQSNLNNMGQSNMNAMGQNNMNNMGPNNMSAMVQNNMGPNNMNRMMQGMNQMGPNAMNAMGPGGVNAMGPNNGMNQMMSNNGSNNRPPGNRNITAPEDLSSIGGNCDSGEQADMMDVDYRIKQNFEESDETSRDLSELDSIRRRLQEQINQEDEEEEGEEEDGEVNQIDDKATTQDEPEEDKSGLSPERQETSSDAAKPTSTLDNIPDIPAHLPKKQRELFMRIHQQQILREKERERQEALKAAEEVEKKVDKDDWYSSSDEDEEDKSKTTLSKDSSLKSVPESSSTAGTNSSNTAPTAAATTFNIMQMINAIRSQGSTASTVESSQVSESATSGHTVETKSPASPPMSPSSSSATPHFPRPALAVEPPVVSATPIKPLKYAIIKISLTMPKTYMFLPEDVDASDPTHRIDPRVKRHLQLVDKVSLPLPPTPKEKEIRRASVDEKAAKLVDPRLKRAPADPRLAKIGGGSPGSGRPDEGRPVDPRLKKDSGSVLNRPVDPRLAKRASSVNNDPRLNRQMSQETGNQMMGGQMNNMGGPYGGNANSMGNMNNMGSPMNNMGSPMNNMGSPMNNMAGPMNSMGGPMGSMGGRMNNMGGLLNNIGGPMSTMGGPINNMGGPINNMGGPMSNMGGPINNMGGPMNNQMGVGMNNMNGPGRPMQAAGPMAGMNRMGGPMNNMGMPLNSMGGPMNAMGGNRMTNPIGVNSEGNMIGQQGSSLLGGPMNRLGGPRGSSNPMSNQIGGGNERVQINFPESPSDPRLSQRSISDPRLNDPRLQIKSQEMSDQGMNRNDPRCMSGKTVKSHEPVNDPRLSNDPRRMADFSRSSDDSARGFSERRSPSMSDVSQEKDFSSTKPTKGVMEPLPSLSSTASLPPLPTLSPPPPSTSSSIPNMQPSPQETVSESVKPAKKLDYRNDPRFKRVKRTAAARQSSMEYSSPLGGEGESQNTHDPAGSLQYNSYNRPKLTDSNSPHRQNAPSPSLPDTLQDFDMPELPPLTVTEPDLKVKDLFKAIDPTASPFC